MKHAREDYNRIQDPAGKIPEEEPVFLIRGQDSIAPDVLHFYADRAEINGASPELVSSVRKHADRIRRWQAKDPANNVKEADLPEDMAAELAEIEDAIMAESAETGQPPSDDISPEDLKAAEAAAEKETAAGNFADLNVDEISEKVEGTDDVELLAEWLEVEENNKDRVTAKRAITNRIEELTSAWPKEDSPETKAADEPE